MSILKRCRFWFLLTSKLVLYNAGLESTHPLDSFDSPLAFQDDARISESLRHGTSDGLIIG